MVRHWKLELPPTFKFVDYYPKSYVITEPVLKGGGKDVMPIRAIFSR
jgi:hypothetical protein